VDNAHHILVVDDDREILELLSSYLESNGYSVATAADAALARESLQARPADLIVLDLMLPGESGLDFCRSLRKGSSTPVIMLTALGETVDRIVGLEVGADDYLPKPFDPRELVSRIRAVLRRSAASGSDDEQGPAAYRFGHWRLDRVSRTLFDKDGTKVDIGGAEFSLLEVLLAHPGQVLSRAELMERLRGREHDPFDRSIDVRVSHLRRALGDDARAPTIVKTVYGKGYTIGVPVESDAE
jgi:two-component system OmpR family response regulator